jgi:lipopolysaccharide/colanic/teichoic acid biosynthesis glycosyltransferase
VQGRLRPSLDHSTSLDETSLDETSVDQRNIWLDLQILVCTVAFVLVGTGSCGRSIGPEQLN